jgi:acyl carrier protein
MRDINKILKEIRPEFDFKNYNNFFKNGLLDSLDLITLISSLDEEYNISIEGTDILPENFESISSIEKLLKKYKVDL